MDLQSCHMGSDAAANSNTITVDDGRSKKPSKLRRTCDPCSEAKVKCDKANPRCGRCDRLSLDCVYSPARRIGRPRPRLPRPQDQDDSAARESREDGGANASLTQSVSASAQAPAQPTQGQPALDEPLPGSLSDDEGRWSGNTSAHAGSNEVSHPNSMSSSENLPRRIEQRSVPGIDEVQHNPYEYDCATVAVETLRQLAAVGLDSQHSSATTQQPATAADVLAEQIPHACRQAARILVCPCSADMDTALLVSSLAAAILDVANAALSTLKPAGHALDDEQHTVLALGTLPSISQVITLFSHRYSVTQASRPPEALHLIAASLRTTLKAMAEETTNRFLDSAPPN